MDIQEALSGYAQHTRWNNSIPTGHTDNVQRHFTQPVHYIRVADVPTFECRNPLLHARRIVLAGTWTAPPLNSAVELGPPVLLSSIPGGATLIFGSTRGRSRDSPAGTVVPPPAAIAGRNGRNRCPFSRTATTETLAAKSLSSTMLLKGPSIPTRSVRIYVDTTCSQAV